MTTLTDELLRRRLADRAERAPATSLAAIAASVAAQPRRRTATFGWRSAVWMPLAGALVVGVALVLGLPRQSGPGLLSPSGSTSGSTAGQPAQPAQPDPVLSWTSLTWQQTLSEPFASDDTIVNDAIAVGDGFVAVGTTWTGGIRAGHIWVSGDGRTWRRIDDPGIAAMTPTRILAVGSTLVVLGLEAPTGDDGAKNLELWWSADHRPWVRGPSLPVPADPAPAAGGPAGILLPVGQDTWLIGPDLAAWRKTASWPADVYLGSPSWADGRWLQPGASGVVGANAATTAAVWTSTDGTDWAAATIEGSTGAVQSIHVADRGFLAVGQSANLCLVCRGPAIQPSTMWTSVDGRRWQRAEGPAALARLGSAGGGQFVGDGHRIIAIGPFVVSLGLPGVPGPTRAILSDTRDGLTWTEIAQGDATPAPDIANAFLVVGTRGVATLPRQNSGGSGASGAVPWWGLATPASPTPQSSGPAPSPTASAASSVDPLARIAGCETLGFDARRCAAVVARAREQASPPLAADEISGATLTRPASDVSLGSFPIADVRFDLIGGGSRDVIVRCGLPGRSDRACNDAATIVVVGGVDHDVPCGAVPGDENHPCATLPPSARPEAVAGSTPLQLPALDIRLDRVGRYEVLAGIAWLPDGVLSERSASIADPRPTTFWIDDGVTIEVRPGPDPCPGTCPRAIDSIYHDFYDGPQQVRVYLVFDVVELDPAGATLGIRDLVVR